MHFVTFFLTDLGGLKQKPLWVPNPRGPIGGVAEANVN